MNINSLIIDPDKLDAGELTFVIELLAALCTEEQVCDRFEQFTNGTKTINARTIQKVQLRYKKLIERQTKAYLTNIKGNPLAHERVLLDILHKVIMESMKERPSHSVKVGDNEFEVVEKPDFSSVLAAIKIAKTIVHDKRSLDQKDQKDNTNSTREKLEEIIETEGWEVDAGI